MKRITCDYCFEDHFFGDDEKRPESCKNCNSPIGHLKVTDALDPVEEEEAFTLESFGLSSGIVLTYQKTGDLIEIPHNEIIILGRQNTGKEVFANISHISREHCKIEYSAGKYLITDLNSMNGTFLGPSRRDCLKHKKLQLKDGDVLYLGREPFLVAIIAENANDIVVEPTEDTEEDFSSLRFKCKGCGKIHDMNLIICDECGSYGQIELLEE